MGKNGANSRFEGIRNPNDGKYIEKIVGTNDLYINLVVYILWIASIKHEIWFLGVKSGLFWAYLSPFKPVYGLFSSIWKVGQVRIVY